MTTAPLTTTVADETAALSALTLAFSTDPAIRWMYPESERYLAFLFAENEFLPVRDNDSIVVMSLRFQRALQKRFLVRCKSRLRPFKMAFELMDRLVHDSELLCVAGAPHAETPVQRQSKSCHKWEGIILLRGSQANDFPASRCDPPHQICNRGLEPWRLSMISDGKGHLDYMSALHRENLQFQCRCGSIFRA
jgi:hypothetical protein